MHHYINKNIGVRAKLWGVYLGPSCDGGGGNPTKGLSKLKILRYTADLKGSTG